LATFAMDPAAARRPIAALTSSSVHGWRSAHRIAPLAGTKRSRAVVAGARIDLVENDQAAFFVCYFAMIQTVSMITTMAMNCSSTRSRMSFCDVLPEPPRIILMRPRRSTTATAPMAIGTATCDMKSTMTGSFHLTTMTTLRGKSNTS
jgi:hypothetical protein